MCARGTGGNSSDQGYGNVSVVRGCHIKQIPSCMDHIAMNCTRGHCSLENWIGSRPHKITGAPIESRLLESRVMEDYQARFHEKG